MTSWRELIFNNMNFTIYWNAQDDSNMYLEDDSNIIDFLSNMENIEIEIEIPNKTQNRIEENIDRKQEKLKSSIDCSICLIELNNKKRIVSKLKCDHLFHKTCIKKWFKQKTSCPICRS